MIVVYVICAVLIGLLALLFISAQVLRHAVERTRVAPLDAHTWHIAVGAGPTASHVYLLEGDERAMLIDTGFGLADLRKVVAGLTQKPVFVVNTHGHCDHVGGNRQFDEIYLHEADFEVYREHTSEAYLAQKVRDSLTDFRLPLWLVHLPFVGGQLRRLYNGAPGPQPIPMRDVTVFDLGGRVVRVIPLPGHTPGSVCLLDEANNIFYFADNGSSQGILLGFSHSSTVAEYGKNLACVRTGMDDGTRLYLGHHKVPLNAAHIDKILRGVEALKAGQLESNPFHSAACEGHAAFYEGFRFVYRDIE